MSKHVAILRLHDFTEYAERVIDRLANHVDGILFVVSDATAPQLLAMAQSDPKALDVLVDNEPWDNGGSLDRAFRVIDKMAPATVLYTDHDELLPDRYGECFEQFLRARAVLCMMQFFFTWGNVETIVARRMRCFWHGKLVKWQPGIRFVPYRGCCLPSTISVHGAYRMPYPLRHLCFTTKAMRDKRMACRRRRRRDRAWIDAETNPTMAYDPLLTFARWCEIADANTPCVASKKE